MKPFLALLLLPLLYGTDTQPTQPAESRSSTQPLKPVRWSLVGGQTPRSMVAGKTVEVLLQAEIAKGWYIYSLTQKPGGPIPLRIQLQDGGDVGLRGAIRAPQPLVKLDRSFGIETELHHGTPTFAVTLGVPHGSLGGKREVLLAARYQACSETLCLPPRTEKVAVSLRINSH